MSRTAFRQRDVSRLIKGAVAAGFPMGAFGIQLIDGRPTLVPTSALSPRPSDLPDQHRDLDDELAAWRACHGQG